MAPIGLFFMIALLGLCACFDASGAKPSSGSSTSVVASPAATIVASSPTPLSTLVPSEKTGQVVITMGENGRSVRLKVGQQLLFALDDALYDHWTIISSNPTPLVADRNAVLPPHTQAVYRAIAPGQTTLTAKGVLTCSRGNPPCLIQPRDIQIQVTVE
jgi:hypothetical protein